MRKNRNCLTKLDGKNSIVKRLFPTNQNKVAVFMEGNAFLFSNDMMAKAEIFNYKLNAMDWRNIDLFILKKK